ncbi:hypothetical protein JCM8097_002193 [Rhodosporidiobolus ruineniae]
MDSYLASAFDQVVDSYFSGLAMDFPGQRTLSSSNLHTLDIKLNALATPFEPSVSTSATPSPSLDWADLDDELPPLDTLFDSPAPPKVEVKAVSRDNDFEFDDESVFYSSSTGPFSSPPSSSASSRTASPPISPILDTLSLADAPSEHSHSLAYLVKLDILGDWLNSPAARYLASPADLDAAHLFGLALIQSEEPYELRYDALRGAAKEARIAVELRGTGKNGLVEDDEVRRKRWVKRIASHMNAFLGQHLGKLDTKLPSTRPQMQCVSVARKGTALTRTSSRLNPSAPAFCPSFYNSFSSSLPSTPSLDCDRPSVSSAISTPRPIFIDLPALRRALSSQAASHTSVTLERRARARQHNFEVANSDRRRVELLSARMEEVRWCFEEQQKGMGRKVLEGEMMVELMNEARRAKRREEEKVRKVRRAAALERVRHCAPPLLKTISTTRELAMPAAITASNALPRSYPPSSPSSSRPSAFVSLARLLWR